MPLEPGSKQNVINDFRLHDKDTGSPEVQILIDPFILYGNHHTWIKEHEWIETRG